jgi:23S rRNA (adenine2030-N6)-methyltransferase
MSRSLPQSTTWSKPQVPERHAGRRATRRLVSASLCAVNYRHVFHAGNFADVHKHVLLIAMLEYLLRKDTPLLYLETHAGRGGYDLAGSDASRSGESGTGIGRLTGSADTSYGDPEIQRYLHVVRQLQSAHARPWYPGSPLIAAALLRPIDRMVLVEKQAGEADALRSALGRRRQTAVLCGDGYGVIKGHLPPREQRGLVLFDPPYEERDESDRLARALTDACERWPRGTLAAWYPLKAGDSATRLHDALRAAGLPRILIAELLVRPRAAAVGLNGSGMLIVNPPWQLDERAGHAQRELVERLASTAQAAERVEWLVPE